jgi:hypothetical protein
MTRRDGENPNVHEQAAAQGRCMTPTEVVSSRYILSGGKWWRIKSCGCCVEEVK